MPTDTHYSEIERLKRLHREAVVGLTALTRLRERSPEDELRLRGLVRLEQRLMDRIEWMEAQNRAAPPLDLVPSSRRGGAPESAALPA